MEIVEHQVAVVMRETLGQAMGSAEWEAAVVTWVTLSQTMETICQE